MSTFRKEKYFHPVKDIFSHELRKKLTESFFEYKNSLSNYENSTSQR